MLGFRARSWGLRDNYSDALQGITQAEEWEDMAPAPKELDPLETEDAEPVVDVTVEPEEPKPDEVQQPAPPAQAKPAEQPPSPDLATDLAPDTLHGYLKDNSKYMELKNEYGKKILKGVGKKKDLPGFHAWCEKQWQKNLRTVPAWTPEVINTCRMALKGTGVA